ncbi:EAL domain-containing protein [Methylomonas sp. AM2-LC]|uniref:putative bifunctional diguanylate cyclase/phosphodiesterase n=1 Tax=Methylomonas sp. AM2-LC TaxID=3153301 RepID=UPI0032674EAB
MNACFINWLKESSRTRLLLSSVLMCVAFSEMLTSALAQLLTGEISSAFLVTGFITSLIASLIFINALSMLQGHQAKLLEDNQSLNDSLIETQKMASELHIAAAIFNAWQSTIITDTERKIVRVNQAFIETTGYSADEVIGRSPNILASDLHTSSKLYTQIWEHIARNGSWQGEVWDKHKNGEIHPKQLSITSIKNDYGEITHYLGTYLDMSLSKQTAEEIERLAFYDPLTGLPNRRLLQERLKQALVSSHRHHRKGCLLFIDLDNFKILNDTLGHDMGDMLLQIVAERLTSCVREGDTVARLGGDEFVVVLENLNENVLEAAKYAELIGKKIQSALRQPYLLNSYDYRSTPSMGATLFSGHEQGMDELLKQADIAMYQAKNLGRNALCFFDPQMQATITARVKLEADLRDAVKQGEFILYYQPQVNQHNHTIGAEVLTRWLHPQRGLVQPIEFIQLMEETGLILALGLWVLETACQQIKSWESSPHTEHLQLAVNVSAHQFRQPDFVENVVSVIQTTCINPDRLKLELTETMVLEDIDDTVSKMNALRAIGVRFSMDDFGTGYSSLSSLKKLPLDQLKIDQSFVQDILIDPDDTVIVQTIIAMANHLGMEVIAEGVETHSQREFLEQHNCQVCQGFLFSKPVPVSEFEALLLAKEL